MNTGTADLDIDWAASLARARDDARATGRALFEAFSAVVESRPFSARRWLAEAGAFFHYPIAEMADLERWLAEVGDPAFDVYPLQEAMRFGVVAWRRPDGSLLAAAADPVAQRPLLRVEAAAGDRAVDWHLAHPADLAALLSRFEATAQAFADVSGASPDADAAPAAADISLASLGSETSAVVRIVHSTLYDALKSGASDIHFESTDHGLAIKYRNDGVLLLAGERPGLETAEQVISRIKVMSGLDIAERRIPQDGRFKATVRGRAIDFRVSIMPSIHGEDAVVRILDKAHLADAVHGLRLEALGFDPATLETIRRLATEPHGMLLVTGPTGSGKTTTLYAVLTEVNNGQEKIVTIEDPVEYQLPGVLQIPVHEKKGLTFARGLRSILRHDPDKIMIGEIRDAETAEIAVQSALTGHLVLTTVHANSVFDVVGRFAHMGIDPYGLVSALNGIVAQRLVRLVCPDCRGAQVVEPEALRRSRIPGATGDWRFVVGKGCGNCRGTGYKGRKAIAEHLVLDDELRGLIAGRAPIGEIKRAAQAQGFASLRQAALGMVRSGETTLAEANRVTSAID